MIHTPYSDSDSKDAFQYGFGLFIFSFCRKWKFSRENVDMTTRNEPILIDQERTEYVCTPLNSVRSGIKY